MLTHTPLARRLAGVAVTIAKRDQRHNHGGKSGEARDLQIASRFALATVQTGTRDALDDGIEPPILGGRGLRRGLHLMSAVKISDHSDIVAVEAGEDKNRQKAEGDPLG